MLTVLIILAVLVYGLLAGVLGYYLALYKLEQAFRLRQETVRDQARKEADAEWEKLLPQVRDEVRQETAAAWQEEMAAVRAETREAVNKEWSERVADLLDEARAEVERDWQKRAAAIREEARLEAERDRPIRPVAAEATLGAAPAQGAWAGKAVTGARMAPVTEGAEASRLGRERTVRLRSEIEREKDRFTRKAQERRAARERADAPLAAPPTAPAPAPASPRSSSAEGTVADTAEAAPGWAERAAAPSARTQAEPPATPTSLQVAPPLGTRTPARENGPSAHPGETLIQQITRKHFQQSPTPPTNR